MTPDELDRESRERLRRFLAESAHHPAPAGLEGRVMPPARWIRPVGRIVGAVVTFAVVAAATAAAVFSSATGPLHQHPARPASTGQPTATQLPVLPIVGISGLGGAIEDFAGGVWTAASPPVPALGAGPNESQGVSLAGVACPSRADCWAVGGGYGGGGGLIEHYDGSTWRIVTQPAAPLTSVSCVSDVDCWAVGGTPGYRAQPVFEHYTGGDWQVVEGPTISDGGALSSVSCPDADHCWAVGSGASATGSVSQPMEPLIEAYAGGVWTVVAGPAIGTGSRGGDSILSAVTCVNASDCWAVGDDGSTGGGLIERGDGTGWTVVPSPTVPAGGPGLVAVSCAAATDCWAVGDGGVERYQGAAWTLVNALPHGIPSTLQSVTCIASDDCWAVGEERSGPETGGLAGNPLIERWQGSEWTAVPSLPTGLDLEAVACSGSDSCWAVGSVIGGTQVTFAGPSTAAGTVPLLASPAATVSPSGG